MKYSVYVGTIQMGRIIQVLALGIWTAFADKAVIVDFGLNVDSRPSFISQ